MDEMGLVVSLLPFLSYGLTKLPFGRKWSYLITIPWKHSFFDKVRNIYQVATKKDGSLLLPDFQLCSYADSI